VLELSLIPGGVIALSHGAKVDGVVHTTFILATVHPKQEGGLSALEGLLDLLVKPRVEAIELVIVIAPRPRRFVGLDRGSVALDRLGGILASVLSQQGVKVSSTCGTGGNLQENLLELLESGIVDDNDSQRKQRALVQEIEESAKNHCGGKVDRKPEDAT